MTAPSAPVLWASPPEGSVLVLAPHPDDETLGPGGSLALHAARGDRVRVVFCTDGRAGDPEGHYGGVDYVELRQREAARAAEILGVSGVEFWGFADGHLSEAEGFEARLLGALRESPPDTLYYPSLLETHPDHRAVAVAAGRAVRSLARPLVACAYEVYTPVRPSHLADITPVWGRKQRAIEQYASQLRYDNFLHKTLGLNLFRASVLGAALVRYAEAFVVERAGEQPVAAMP